MKFKYKDKIYETPNLEKKLKRLKISIEDIEILEEIPKEAEDNTPEWKLKGLIKHCWINRDTLYSIWGFHYSNEDLSNLKDKPWVYINNVEDYGYGRKGYKEFIRECITHSKLT